MAEQVQKGYSDTSDDEVNEILQGFVLTPKIDGEINSNVFAGHSWFNCTCTRVGTKSYRGDVAPGAPIVRERKGDVRKFTYLP